jgi:hypothetical protein
LPEQLAETKPSISSSLSVKNTPIRDGRGNQTENLAQPQINLLNEKIANLESRLRYIEATTSKQAKDKTVSRNDKPDVNNGTEKTKAKRLSEADFGHWMDESLDTGHFDRDATKLTMDKAVKDLANVPDITLTDMQCDERFCRATLTPENGKPLDISQLIGASTFMSSGTTIEDSDGRVRIYFTQPGQASLSELQSEAQKIFFEGISTNTK